MTSLVRLYIKTSFVFLLLGLILGGYITVVVNLAGRAVPWPLITAHVHLLLVGFMLTLVFGVATWMFPRPAREDARYRPGLAWLVYWLLTASTVVRMLGELGAAVAGARGTATGRSRRTGSARGRPRLRGQHVDACPHARRPRPAGASPVDEHPCSAWGRGPPGGRCTVVPRDM